MDVTSTTNTNAATPSTTTTTQPPSTESASAALSTDFDTFLTLLTAQLKAQDPLEPVDSTEWIAQLATFSNVEQQISTNNKLDQLIEAFEGGGDIESLGQWIGKDVEASPDKITFDGQEIRFAAPKQDQYDGVTAAITNADGEVVRTMDLSLEDETHVWDGATDDGVRARLGEYTIELTYRASGLAPKTETAPLAGTVTEVRKTEEGWRLQFEDGRQISVDDVTAARSATADADNSTEQQPDESA